jgi:peroxiredoxin
VNEQRQFADEQSFPYQLLSDPDRSAGTAYDAVRQPGEKFAEHGLPRRISYLIDPDGRIAQTYDLDGKDLAAHAAEILDDIRSRM